MQPRFGWRAPPALLEALDEENTDLARAEGACGLCFDIEELVATAHLSLGPCLHWRGVDRWPASDAPPIRMFGTWNMDAVPTPDETRRAYHDQWRALRPCVELVLED